jgi:PhnB protein
VPLEDGSIGHAEVRVGDTVLLAFDQRGGRVPDPFGNIWWISAIVEDVAPKT